MRFVFRGEIVTREDLGNITYRYLGSAMGIGDATLYWESGVAAQGIKNVFSDDVRDASKYYGDSPKDHMTVKKGIELFYEDYPEVYHGTTVFFRKFKATAHIGAVLFSVLTYIGCAVYSSNNYSAHIYDCA